MRVEIRRSLVLPRRCLGPRQGRCVKGDSSIRPLWAGVRWCGLNLQSCVLTVGARIVYGQLVQLLDQRLHDIRVCSRLECVPHSIDTSVPAKENQVQQVTSRRCVSVTNMAIFSV